MGQNTAGNEPRSTIGEAPETEIVSAWRVACDGGGAAFGHPRVWLQIPEDLGWVECGYCDKRFVHESVETLELPVQPHDPKPGIP